MNLKWQTSLDGVSWIELCDLYRIAPLGEKDPVELETSFSNSMYKFFAYQDGKLVGVGRALADGADCSYICDVAVHPDFQGTGLGKEIISRLTKASQGHKKIILYAVPGKEAFYNKFGFRRMTTAMAIFADQDKATKSGYLTQD
ncbi:MAG: GNAT family N-acetyltransferase [Alphaproteobacteria bacterium]|nr:GNAT family N-acetyltransferase [Alphaproteobacteria bacterium]MBT4086698.1 GNAT family N-acetyltransferase [Alphaproteobacteria bacterium]MBT4546282.1 GNAT family N-acetyltransferase [Alphaproteobacteria bacterium]MBT5161176.1 GNAT family N-acetyltransferase [Alphaproteobacteria bacterium]MBT6385772.1 GNAT family N-acetyltransferase [Alphaproteobacteria bacterium]